MANLISFLRDLRLHHLSAGLVAVVVAYTSSAALIFQAAATAGASTRITSYNVCYTKL